MVANCVPGEGVVAVSLSDWVARPIRSPVEVSSFDASVEKLCPRNGTIMEASSVGAGWCEGALRLMIGLQDGSQEWEILGRRR